MAPPPCTLSSARRYTQGGLRQTHAPVSVRSISVERWQIGQPGADISASTSRRYGRCKSRTFSQQTAAIDPPPMR